ncbi:MAG: MGMT family protein [Opitutus sp.]
MQTLMCRVSFPTAFGRCAISWHAAGLTSFELPEASARVTDEASAPPEILVVISRVQKHLTGIPQDFSDLQYDFSELAAFDRAVVEVTLAVKSGETRSYGGIAAALGQPAGVSRAVGSALGANRWPLLIPCHRIVAANGKMTGFSGPGGVLAKTRLLALEGAQLLSE